MRQLIIACLLLCTLPGYCGDYERQKTMQRIRPIGQINEGASQVKAKPVAQPTQVVKKLAPGEKTYQQFCAACHTTGVAGAPKYREAAAWDSRTKAKDLAALTQSAIKGINAMPPKGTCMTCTDEQIKQAIEYMLPKK